VMHHLPWKQNLGSVVAEGDTQATSKVSQHAWHISKHLLHICVLSISASPLRTPCIARFDQPSSLVHHFFQLDIESGLLQAAEVVMLPILLSFCVFISLPSLFFLFGIDTKYLPHQQNVKWFGCHNSMTQLFRTATPILPEAPRHSRTGWMQHDVLLRDSESTSGAPQRF